MQTLPLARWLLLLLLVRLWLLRLLWLHVRLDRSVRVRHGGRKSLHREIRMVRMRLILRLVMHGQMRGVELLLLLLLLRWQRLWLPRVWLEQRMRRRTGRREVPQWVTSAGGGSSRRR